MNNKNSEETIDKTEADSLRSLLNGITEETPIPASGHELILLEIDPHRAHAYWNIDPQLADVSRPLVLRVHDVTDTGSMENADQSFDVEVQGLQGRWYLDFWRDDRTFISEIGYRNPDGSLQRIAVSNEVRTPPAGPVSEPEGDVHLDPNGKQVRTEWPGLPTPPEPALLAPTEPEAATVESPETQPLVVEPITLLDPHFPLSNWKKIVVDPLPESPGLEQATDSLLSPAEAAGDTAMAVVENENPASADPAENIFPGADELRNAVLENHAAVAAFYEAVAELPPPPADHPVAAPSTEQGSVPSSPVPAAAANQPVPAPLEQIVGLSSMESGRKDVLLEVNAELHIYGRAKPNTELSLYGQVVKTRPDGTFSVRRVLPHGAVVLPLLYTSPQN